MRKMKLLKYSMFESSNEVENHYLEDVQKAFEREIDPFPINLEITFKEVDDNVYDFSLHESSFELMTPWPHEESLGWYIVRQAIFDALGGKGTWNGSKSMFYMSGEGVQSIIDKSPSSVNGAIGDAYVTIFKKIETVEEFYIVLDNVLFKPYKQFPADVS
jgi:hypothetical protein